MWCPNLNPKLLYLKLIDEHALDADFRAAHAQLQMRVGDLAHERRAFRAAGFHLPARTHSAASITSPASSWRRRLPTWSRPISMRARYGCSRAPVVEMLIPSHRGRYARARRPATSRACSASISITSCPDGKSWDDEKETAADLVIDTVNRYAPNFKASVLGRMVLVAARSRARIRTDRRRYFPRRADARPALQRASGARPRRVPRTARAALHVRRGHASGRRRERAART